jgi:hypothetical protein
MTDATAEMQEKGEGGCEQHNLTGPGRYEYLHRGVGLRSRRRRNQPDNQNDGADAEKYPGDPIKDR